MIERQNESLPRCFGTKWDDKSPECTGGLDPTFTDPDTGSHIRERCSFFNPCGARVQAAKMQQLIPVSQVVRPPQTQQPPAPPAGMMQSQFDKIQQLTSQVQQLQQVVQQQNAQMARQGTASAFIHPMQAAVHPIQMLPVEYKMPGYLTVPEPRGKNSTVWAMLGRSVARSALKSVGHTLAAFWDTTPLGDDDEIE